VAAGLGGACDAYGGGERPRLIYEKNIKIDLRKIGWNGFTWRRIGTGGGML
jgi:hypothetical protein